MGIHFQCCFVMIIEWIWEMASYNIFTHPLLWHLKKTITYHIKIACMPSPLQIMWTFLKMHIEKKFKKIYYPSNTFASHMKYAQQIHCVCLSNTFFSLSTEVPYIILLTILSQLKSPMTPFCFPTHFVVFLARIKTIACN